MKTILTASLYLLPMCCSAIPFEWGLSSYGNIGFDSDVAEVSPLICDVYAKDSRPSHMKDGNVVGTVYLSYFIGSRPVKMRGLFGHGARPFMWPVCEHWKGPSRIIGAIHISSTFLSWWPNMITGPSLLQYETSEVKIPATERLTPGSTDDFNYYIDVTAQSTSNVRSGVWTVDPDLTIRGYIVGVVAGEYTVVLSVRVTPL